MQTHRKHSVQMLGTITYLSSAWAALYSELRWIINTVLTCFELQTLTSFLKVRNMKPLLKNQKGLKGLSDSLL